MITFWKSWDVTEENDAGEAEVSKRFVLRTFTVFNADQTEGLPAKFYGKPEVPEFTELADAQAVLDGYFAADGAPKLAHKAGDSAHYTTDGTDTVVLPKREQFRSPGAYYATAFHEAAHSTGWMSRLGRDGIVKFDHFGTGQYAREELIAEMGAAFLSAETGTDPGQLEQSAAYLATWLGALKDDKKLVVSAAAAAQRAAEFITSAGAEAGEAEAA